MERGLELGGLVDLQTQVLPHFLEEKQFRGGKKGGAKESWEKEQRESKYIIINMRMVNINMRMEKYEKSENIKRWVTVRELGGGGMHWWITSRGE